MTPLRDIRSRLSYEADVERTLRRYDDALAIFWNDMLPAKGTRNLFERRQYKERWQVCRIGDIVRRPIWHEPGVETIYLYQRRLHVVLTVEDNGRFRYLDEETVAQIVRMDQWATEGRGAKAAAMSCKKAEEACAASAAKREQRNEDLLVEVAKYNEHEFRDAAEDQARMMKSTHGRN